MTRYCPRCWHENDYGAQRCEYCGADLRQEGGDYVDHLITSLQHPVAGLRELAAALLGRSRDPRALRPLEEAAHLAIEQQDWTLLDGIAIGLTAYGSPETAPALRFISEHGSVAARRVAQEALALLAEADPIHDNQ